MQELNSQLKTIAQQYNLTLIKRTDFHWQLLDGKLILTNVWPTVLKVRHFWPSEQHVTAECKSIGEVVNLVELLAKRYRHKPSAEQLAGSDPKPVRKSKFSPPAPRVEQKPVTPALPVTAPIAQHVEQDKSLEPTRLDKPTTGLYPDLNRRTVACDLSLEGRHLRIIINGSSFSDSFRLTAEDTLIFLAKARQAWETLDLTKPETHVMDCRPRPPQSPVEVAAALFAGNPGLVAWRVAACLPNRTPEFLDAVQRHYRILKYGKRPTR